MKKAITRYIIGFVIGYLLMHLGRYKIHGYEVLIISVLIVAVILDLLHLKSRS